MQAFIALALADARQKLEWPAEIESDSTWFGYPRLTHRATGCTLVRQPFMSDLAWERAKQSFITTHTAPMPLQGGFKCQPKP